MNPSREPVSVISRRDLLRGLGASALCAATPWAPKLYGQEPSPRVVVVGAGLAGLAAARWLVQQGAEVLVLESQGRPGGRIQTLREPFADGLEAEAGGDAIGSSYRTLLGLVRELGLSVVPSEGAAALRRGDILLHLAGRKVLLSELRRDPARWPLPLHDSEKAVAPFGLLGHYLGPLVRELGDPAKVLEPKWLEYDQLSLDQLLEKRGASPAARRLVDHVLNANQVSTVSALSVMRELARLYAGGSGTFRIAGGNDRLPIALAAELGERVHYGVRLLRVKGGQSGPSVQLSLEQQGQQHTLQASAVVLTLPCTALRRVVFDPALPSSRLRAIASLPYTQVTKVFVQARRRFWRDDLGLSAVWSDGPYERLFDYRGAPQGPRALALSWINGNGAMVRQAVQSQEGSASSYESRGMVRRRDDLAAGVVAHMGQLFPEHAPLLESAHVVDWHASYCEGAYAHFAPGQMAAWAAGLARPIGRLFFAGEHTELVQPGMEGALVSGQRAAREALAAVRGQRPAY